MLHLILFLITVYVLVSILILSNLQNIYFKNPYKIIAKIKIFYTLKIMLIHRFNFVNTLIVNKGTDFFINIDNHYVLLTTIKVKVFITVSRCFDLNIPILLYYIKYILIKFFDF